jgi:hypothetical protein
MTVGRGYPSILRWENIRYLRALLLGKGLPFSSEGRVPVQHPILKGLRSGTERYFTSTSDICHVKLSKMKSEAFSHSSLCNYAHNCL